MVISVESKVHRDESHAESLISGDKAEIETGLKAEVVNAFAASRTDEPKACVSAAASASIALASASRANDFSRGVSISGACTTRSMRAAFGAARGSFGWTGAEVIYVGQGDLFHVSPQAYYKDPQPTHPQELTMALRIGDEAPDFTAQTTEGTIRFHDWIGDKWAVLFSHPKGFHARVHDRAGLHGEDKPEFDKRNTKVIGPSIDPVDDHKRWVQGHRGDAGTASTIR